MFRVVVIQTLCKSHSNNYVKYLQPKPLCIFSPTASIHDGQHSLSYKSLDLEASLLPYPQLTPTSFH